MISAALAGALLGSLAAGEPPEPPCTVNDPATIRTYCDMRTRFECVVNGKAVVVKDLDRIPGNAMCKPIYDWIAKPSRQS